MTNIIPQEKLNAMIGDFYEAVDDKMTEIVFTEDVFILAQLALQLTIDCERFARELWANTDARRKPPEIPAYLTEANAHEAYEVDSLIEWIIDPELFGLACPDEVRVKATRARDARGRLREAYRKHDRARSASD